LGLERLAASEVGNCERHSPANQYNDEEIAYTPFARHDGNADILKQNGQLKEQVCQDVKLNGPDRNLPRTVSCGSPGSSIGS
jgi:hypothetical protein